jgi:hypothetical protein
MRPEGEIASHFAKVQSLSIGVLHLQLWELLRLSACLESTTEASGTKTAEPQHRLLSIIVAYLSQVVGTG